jgi:agmatinase
MERNFGGIEDKYCSFENAAILLQSVPYDGTSTWGKGANDGFEAFLEAAENMELYDIETDSEVYTKGVHILPVITEDSSPEAMTQCVYDRAKEMLETGKFPTFFGGEHSISIGAIKAVYEKHPDISILHFDAHADLRPSYMGSECNHACALHDASKHTNLVQLGIRSMDSVEKPFINKNQIYFAEDMYANTDWIQKSFDQLGDKVYITIDLDAFDPSIMPATGTPEPGGLDWNTVIKYLHRVFKEKNVVGFDIVELAPIEGFKAPNFLVAKLYYKMLSYKFKYYAK